MDFRLLRADEIEVRVSRIVGKDKKTCVLLLFKDARADMTLLDETVGAERWQRKHELINGNLFCSVGILCNDQWVWKQDVGTESNTEKEKGQASDAFKRACFNWGIGRELYTGPFIAFYDGEFNLSGTTTYDTFKVTGIDYEERRIKSVTVKNTKNGKEKTFTHDVSKIEPTREDIIRKMLKEAHFSEKSLLEHYGHESLSEITPEEEGEILHKCKTQIEANEAKKNGKQG